MSKTFKINAAAIITILAMFITHLSLKDFSNPYERPIAGDAQAYYAYLPAIFIYQDLEYSFVKEINEKYYPPHYGKSFVYVVEGEKVNKTFPGVAVLYSPFFFLAHITAHLSGQEANGYSVIYQFFFDLGYWVYLFFGIIFFGKVLRKLSFSEQSVHLASVMILLTTNVFFYSMFDQSVTHVFNFFMINALVYCLLQYLDKRHYKLLGFSVALLVLIGITRPTNALVILFLLFFINKTQDIRNLIRELISLKNVFKTAIIVLLIGCIPFLLWYFQTGKWIVYSYGEEGFDFAHPHLFEFLFSFTKGWFTYTPIAMLILSAGFIILWKKNKKQFSLAIGFYFLSIYVFSSWWCWYYGAGMSQRVMIDYYLLLGFLFATIWETVRERKVFQSGIIISLVVFGFFNIAQAFQIRYGVLPMGSPTAEQYFDNFLSFKRKARVYPRNNWQALEEVPVDLSPRSLMLLDRLASIDEEGTYYLEVKSDQKYSGKVNVPLRNPAMKGSKLKFSFEAKALTEVNETRLVHYLYPDGEQHVFHIAEYLENDKWMRLEILVEAYDGLYKRYEFFFWNGGTDEHVLFRNMKVEHFRSEDYM